MELQFLNFRIIKTKHSVSIDQTNHIIHIILNTYVGKVEKVKYESSMFLLDSKFKYELCASLPMCIKELEQAEKKYKGNTTNGPELYTTYQYGADMILIMQ